MKTVEEVYDFCNLKIKEYYDYEITIFDVFADYASRIQHKNITNMVALKNKVVKEIRLWNKYKLIFTGYDSKIKQLKEILNFIES